MAHPFQMMLISSILLLFLPSLSFSLLSFDTRHSTRNEGWISNEEAMRIFGPVAAYAKDGRRAHLPSLPYTGMDNNEVLSIGTDHLPNYENPLLWDFFPRDSNEKKEVETNKIELEETLNELKNEEWELSGRAEQMMKSNQTNVEKQKEKFEKQMVETEEVVRELEDVLTEEQEIKKKLSMIPVPVRRGSTGHGMMTMHVKKYDEGDHMVFGGLLDQKRGIEENKVVPMNQVAPSQTHWFICGGGIFLVALSAWVVYWRVQNHIGKKEAELVYRHWRSIDTLNRIRSFEEIPLTL